MRTEWKIFFHTSARFKEIRHNDERAEHQIFLVSLVVKAQYNELKYNNQIILFLNYIVQKGFFWDVVHKTNHWWSVIKKTTSLQLNLFPVLHSFIILTNWTEAVGNLTSLLCFSFFIIPYVPTISRGIVVKNDKNL